MSDKSPVDTQPLVSLIVFSYNQQDFIRDAIHGAFAQTYGNLEIIISDDYSTDNTFRIIQEMAASYEGPHQLVINRNSENLGIAKHLDKVYRLARGRLLVNAAGDDISLPERVSRLVETWTDQDLKPSLIFSNAVTFQTNTDSQGLMLSGDLGHFFTKLENPFCERHLYGCTAAIDKSLIEYFDPIEQRFMSEDALAFRRAHLLNGVLYLPVPLVKYRIGIVGGAGNISHTKDNGRTSYIRRELTWAKDRIARFSVHKKDVIKANPGNKPALLRIVADQERKDRHLIRILKENLISSTFALLRAAHDFRHQGTIVKELCKLYFARWVPFSYWFVSK